ncbi:MAG: lipid-A-disaccharide synthase, partial [Alphaproteobacteria bacterium]|nr:lipid-A-disaccharide synthase [Alphaproteobacteria bacterium]
MTVPKKPISLMLVCGEPSGDQLGGQLMAGLRALAGDSIVISGVGGRAMEAQGLKSLFPLDDTAVMGLREVVPKIPRILGRVRDACDYALATRPDAVVLIDSPDFTHRIARAVKRRDASIATINYVAPQVWASRAYRARAMARYFDLVLALLPFEPPFFESYNLSAVFVGHPVLERAAGMTGGAELRRRLGIAPDAPLLAVLPGSRSNEIRFILPVFREAVRLIAARVPG